MCWWNAPRWRRRAPRPASLLAISTSSASPSWFGLSHVGLCGQPSTPAGHQTLIWYILINWMMHVYRLTELFRCGIGTADLDLRATVFLSEHCSAFCFLVQKIVQKLIN
jgi:hypothetical protein